MSSAIFQLLAEQKVHLGSAKLSAALDGNLNAQVYQIEAHLFRRLFIRPKYVSTTRVFQVSIATEIFTAENAPACVHNIVREKWLAVLLPTVCTWMRCSALREPRGRLE